MIAIKGNKSYKVMDGEENQYLKRGFDILDDNGKLIETSDLKTIKYSEHEKILKEKENEIKKLKADLKKSKSNLKGKDVPSENKQIEQKDKIEGQENEAQK